MTTYRRSLRKSIADDAPHETLIILLRIKDRVAVGGAGNTSRRQLAMHGFDDIAPLAHAVVQIATEKSCGNTIVTVPVHPEFAESLRAARAAGIIGAEVFTGKIVWGRVVPMDKKA